MNQYVTGAVIKELREKNKMTQLQLAERHGLRSGEKRMKTGGCHH